MEKLTKNTGFVTDDWTWTRKTLFQTLHKDIVIQKDGFVKAPFSDPAIRHTEWMWVLVESVDEEVVKGKLYNDPVFLTNVKYLDEVVVFRKDIADYLEP